MYVAIVPLLLVACCAFLPEAKPQVYQTCTQRTRVQRQTDPLTLTLVISTNTSENCSTGLSYPGVLLLVEYRVVSGTGEWQLLQRVILDTAVNGCAITVDLSDQNFNIGPNDDIQLRIVQPEHGGGTCNCWGVRELFFTLQNRQNYVINDEQSCVAASQLMSTAPDENCYVQFCGGSASVPRGVVYPPVSLNGGGTVLDCPNDSTDQNSLTDIKGPPPTNCSSTEPRLELSFVVDVSQGTCNSPNGFEEGVEVSVGSNGQWTPLVFYSISESKSETLVRADIGNPSNGTIMIRGYDIPYVVQSDDNGLQVNLSVCGDEILRDGIQVRWLQTTVLETSDSSYTPRDVITLSNLSVRLIRNQIHKIIDGFQQLVLRNSHISSDTNFCEPPHFGESQLVLGHNCTTPGCELRHQPFSVSRIGVTPPLNISSFLSPIVSDVSSTISPTQSLRTTTVMSVGASETGAPGNTSRVSVRQTPSLIQSLSISRTPVLNISMTPMPESSQPSNIRSTTATFLTNSSVMSMDMLMTTFISSVSTLSEPTSSPSQPTTSTPSQPTTSTPSQPTTSTPPQPTTSTPSQPTTSIPPQPTTSTPPQPMTSTPPQPTTSTPPQPTTSTPPQPMTSTPPQPTTSIPPQPTTSTPSRPTTSTPSQPTTSIARPEPIPLPTPVEIYVAMERQQITLAFSNALIAINNNEVLQAIQEQLPEQAILSLGSLVTGDQQIEDVTIVYLLSDILRRAVNLTDIEGFSQAVVNVVDSLISQSVSNNQSNTIVGSTLLATVEQLALNVLSPNIEGPRTSNIEVEVFSTNINSTEEFFSGIDVRDNSIEIPTELLRIVGNGTAPVTVASVYYRNMSGLLPGTLPGDQDSILASPVISTSLQCGDRLCNTSDIQLSQPVIITLPHSEHVQSLFEDDDMRISINCVFWQFITESVSPLVSGRWDTDGCERNDLLSNSTQTVCQCTHLTNFAILLSAQPPSLPAGVALSLSIIGYIGVSSSIMAMLATIVALVFLKSLWSMRNFIHINLCVSLILSQLTFVIGVTPYGGGDVVGPGCRTAAVLMHYLFLVSFMWMLMEGVVLYVALVRVFVKHQKRYMIGFFVFSYGAPLLYMVLCVPLGFAPPPEQSDYGYGYIQAANETTDIPSIVCWLNPYTNFVWTFIAPVLVTILVNVGFFIMAFVIMYRHAKRQSHKTRIQKAKYWLKSSVSLVTIMGITWIIGVLVFEVPALLPLAYIFTIFVAFQGVAIFIIFVPLSKQVREAYSKWWKVKVAESDILSRHFGDWSLSQGKSSTATCTTGARTPIGLSPPSSAFDLESSFSKSVTLESSLSKSELESTLSKPLSPNLSNQTKDETVPLENMSNFDVVYVASNSHAEPQKEDLGNNHHNDPVWDCTIVNGDTLFTTTSTFHPDDNSDNLT